MKRRSINVAMIGHGFMGRAHSNAFRQVGRFFDVPYEPRLKLICGRTLTALETMAAQWGWDEVATEWESVIARKDIDVVDVCTPNFLHAPISEAAARAGKIVLCEKPLAMSAEESRSMSAATRNVPTLVWFNYRRVPAIALAKRLIDEGRVGEVYHYRATYLQSWGQKPTPQDLWRFRTAEAGSGAIGDLLSHSVDLALWLNGAIAEVSALTRTFAPGRPVDDAVALLARFSNGSIGTLEASRFATGCRNRNYFEIQGSKGAIRFNLEDLNRLEVFSGDDATEIQGSHAVLVTEPNHPYVDHYWPPGHTIGYEHTFISTLADFLQALQDNTSFHPNFEDSIPVQEVLEAVEQSARGGAWVSVRARADGVRLA